MLGICHLVIRGFIVVKNRSQGINQNQPVGKINEIHICIYIYIYSAASKYYSSAGQQNQKNKKNNGQIKFSAVTVKQRIKLFLWYSLCK